MLQLIPLISSEPGFQFAYHTSTQILGTMRRKKRVKIMSLYHQQLKLENHIMWFFLIVVLRDVKALASYKKKGILLAYASYSLQEKAIHIL